LRPTNIVMLKRISEAISQSNILENLPAYETHRSRHSLCNFSWLKIVVADCFHSYSPSESATLQVANLTEDK